MKDLISEAQKVQKWLVKKRWSFCFIGGLAVQHWGEVRITQDFDLTIFTGFGKEAKFIDQLLAKFSQRTSNQKSFAQTSRVILLQTSAKMPFDISFGAVPYEEEMMQRARYVSFGAHQKLKLCSAEDLIILKAFAGRLKDWVDIESIIKKQGVKQLDWIYVDRYLPVLLDLKEAPENYRELIELKKKYSKYKF